MAPYTTLIVTFLTLSFLKEYYSDLSYRIRFLLHTARTNHTYMDSNFEQEFWPDVDSFGA